MDKGNVIAASAVVVAIVSGGLAEVVKINGELRALDESCARKRDYAKNAEKIASARAHIENVERRSNIISQLLIDTWKRLATLEGQHQGHIAIDHKHNDLKAKLQAEIEQQTGEQNND